MTNPPYDLEFMPSQEWLDSDREWGEIAGWLLNEVITDFIDETEDGGYI